MPNGFAELLSRTMNQMNFPSSIRERLDRFRGYVSVLVRGAMQDHRFPGMEMNDIVQQIYLHAVNGIDDFRGDSTGEMAAWLRTITARVISNLLRDGQAAKRSAHLEISLDQQLNDSSNRLAQFLHDSRTETPSAHARQNEEMLRMSSALEQLPDLQRQAIILKHLKDLPLAEVAMLLDRTPASVASLLRRGLKKLRELLREEASHDC